LAGTGNNDQYIVANATNAYKHIRLKFTGSQNGNNNLSIGELAYYGYLHPDGYIDGTITANHLTVAGNVGIGTINPLYPIDVNGDIKCSQNIRANGAQYGNKLYMNSYGLYYNGSSGAGTPNGIAFKWASPRMHGRVDNAVDMTVGVVSDRRLKKNIKSITPETSREFLDVIKPRSYNSAECYISGVKISCDGDETIYGGVAQEIEEHFPELVHSPEDDGLKSLHAESIVFMTISSLQLVDKNVKDLQTTIEQLEARVVALENK
jgi:hypothetical protein